MLPSFLDPTNLRGSNATENNLKMTFLIGTWNCPSAMPEELQEK